MPKIHFELSQGDRGQFYVITKKTYDKKSANKIIKQLMELQNA